MSINEPNDWLNMIGYLMVVRAYKMPTNWLFWEGMEKLTDLNYSHTYIIVINSRGYYLHAKSHTFGHSYYNSLHLHLHLFICNNYIYIYIIQLAPWRLIFLKLK